MHHVIAIVALSIGCGAWIAFQRWIARMDPGQPGVEGGCTNCKGGCER